MERLGYWPFIFLAIIGLILVGSVPSKQDLGEIKYAYQGVPTSSLLMNNTYVLNIDDSRANELREVDDTLFWIINSPQEKTSAFYALSPAYAFNETGTYTINTYQPSGRLLATDSITVEEGEYIDFELASEVFTEGDDRIAYNKSTFKKRTREWVIENEAGEEELLDASSDTLVALLMPGAYSVVLRLYNDLDTIEERKGFTVKKYIAPKPEPAPKKVQAPPSAPAPKPKPKPKPDPIPTPKPKSKPAPKELPSDAWYHAEKGFGKFVVGPTVPKKADSHFSGGTVVIQIVPKTDVQLSSFSFWGNHNTGNYSIVYECMSCKESSQKRLRPFVFRTGNDFYASQTRYLDSKAIGFRVGHTYKITITTQETTEMQFEKLDQTKFDDENVTLEFLTDRSSVFGLTFLKRQE